VQHNPAETHLQEAGDITRLSAHGFSKLSMFISQELGIKMPAAKLPMLQSRLMRRVRELGLESVEQYAEYFLHSPHAADERIQFINAITTNKTDFFREPAHFEYLTATVLPYLHADSAYNRSRPVGVWSAGCSSGEEPYTLAMVLSEFAGRNRGFTFSILATDISTRVLERAHAGIYDESLIAPIPLALRAKYLLRSKDPGRKMVRMVPQLRRTVSFERLNFMAASYSFKTAFDVVFFRNVMIYFDRPTQEKVLNRICRNLTSGGYLFTGHSETLAGLDVPVVPAGPAIYRKS
jgi:chemotaxis protein methyltransferase CheR